MAKYRGPYLVEIHQGDDWYFQGWHTLKRSAIALAKRTGGTLFPAKVIQLTDTERTVWRTPDARQTSP